MRYPIGSQCQGRCAAQLLGWLGLYLVTACAQPPQQPPISTPPKAICPPAAPTGYVCAAPTPCRLDPKVVALDNGPLGALLPPNIRAAINHGALMVRDLCE